MSGLYLLQDPRWFASFLVAGWLLGWLAVGDRRWAVLPALATVLAVLMGVFQLFTSDSSDYSADLTRTAFLSSLGLPVLWGISRFPSLSLRVGLATALVPLVVPACFEMCGMLFLGIFQIP
ncbi:hypothetical protein [Deinococcus sp. AJ005]|uniref:hypothetical protein n=1 Tax=Deinococcus sp. AJ005 TaxID=2652443 RepID=UPI001865749D|nr:hypothetical protein [Deinococcus sp. AJ005]